MEQLHDVSGKTLRLQDRLRRLSAPGDMVTYQELSSLIDEDVQAVGRGKLRTAIKRAEAETPGVFFAPERGIGIKRVSHEDAVGFGTQAIATVRRKSRRTLVRLSRVQIDQISEAAKMSHTVAAAVLGAVSLFSKSSSQKRIEQAARSNGDVDVDATVKLFSSK